MPRTVARLALAAGVLGLVAGACGQDQEPGSPASVAPAPEATVPDTVPSTSAASPTPARSVTSGPTTAASTAPTSTTTTTLAPLQMLAYEQIAEGLPFPVFATSPSADDRLFIVTKDGRIWIHDGSTVLDTPFLDIRDAVRNDGEQGLLGLAFHPSYPEDPRLFVHYTAGDGDTVLAEYQMDPANAGRALPDGVVLYRTDQPAGNHNGGMVQFGPDGLLYLGLGDGGGANDRFGHGQRSDTPLGALLRFDVSTPGTQRPGPDAPFDEPLVWAFGLRNPWRFDIDGDFIYIADVGQNAYEEVTVAPLGSPANYGWPITEGLHCFSPRSGCQTDGMTLPAIEVAHGDGGSCSITGGFVYRGAALPEVAGHFFYSDFCGGFLRSFRYEGGAAVDLTDWTSQVGEVGSVTSFGEDADGELYVLTAGGGVYRITGVR